MAVLEETLYNIGRQTSIGACLPSIDCYRQEHNRIFMPISEPNICVKYGSHTLGPYKGMFKNIYSNKYIEPIYSIDIAVGTTGVHIQVRY